MGTNFSLPWPHCPSPATGDLAGTGSDLTIGSIGYNTASQITTLNRSNDAYAWTGHGNGSTATVINGFNELATVGGVAAGYDAKGNLTSDPTTGRSYVYTAENRLATSAGTNLIYDPLGRLYGILSGRILDYDGDDMVLETDQPTGTVTYSRYVFAPGEDEPIVWYEGGGTTDRRFLQTDERGSVVAVSDSSGALLNIDTYDEYGKPGAANSGRFQYTGQIWLPEAALYHDKARDYVPQLGVFAQTDLIGQDGGPNLYAYVLDDPVNATDPLGLCTPYVTSIGASPVISGCRLEDAPRFSSGGPLVSPGERNGGDRQDKNENQCPAKSFVPPPAAVLPGEAVASALAISPLLPALLLPLLLSGDTPQQQPQYVVRGGIASATNLMRSTASFTYHGVRMSGFSVVTSPGMTVAQLAAHLPAYGQVSYTTTAQLAGVGAPVVPTPGNNNPYHATVTAPAPLDPARAQVISNQFNTIPNPAKC